MSPSRSNRAASRPTSGGEPAADASLSRDDGAAAVVSAPDAADVPAARDDAANDDTPAARDDAAAADPPTTRDDGAAADPPTTDAADTSTPDDAAAADGPASTETAGSFVIASDHDLSGIPIHRGWSPVGAHRWMEPFVLAFLASGASHGYAIVGELAGLGITNGPVDVGQVYRTLRDLEQAGHVVSSWTTGTGPARRDYDLTEAGYAALDEWAAVMKERGRLIAEFDARYLEWTAGRRKRRVASASRG